LPPQFAYPAALGDLLAAVLAFISIFLVLRNSVYARPMVWVFNVWGTLDLLDAITLATIYGAPVFMGPAYWIPAFWVPALLVTITSPSLSLPSIGEIERELFFILSPAGRQRTAKKLPKR
jgi:hypothetical protein